MFQSYIGWDESLYLLVASRLKDGHPPYTVIWDNKPPGIYFLFSLALILLGNSIVSIQILTCIAIATNCYLIYQLGKVIGKNDFLMGLLAGILYLIYTVKIDGTISGNTELFFTPFVLFAFYLFFSEKNNYEHLTKPSRLTLFKIGLSFGIAFQIKQVVIFDFIGIIIILCISLYPQKIRGIKYLFISLLKLSIPLSLGLVIPSSLILFYFIINGHFSDYLFANFAANVSRINGISFPITLLLRILQEQILTSFLLWLCLFLTPFYIIFIKEPERKDKRNLIYLIIWFCMTFISIILIKAAYSHYYLQLLPPLCLISSYLIIKTIWRLGELDKKREFIVLTLIVLQPFLSSTFIPITQSAKFVYFRFMKGISQWGETEITITARYLQEHVNKEDYIYIADLPVTIYFLVDAKIPTKYAFPSFMNDQNLQKIPGINSVQELTSIMRKKPIYVVKMEKPDPIDPTFPRDDEFYGSLNSYLKKDYVLDKQIKNIQVYRLREMKKGTSLTRRVRSANS